MVTTELTNRRARYILYLLVHQGESVEDAAALVGMQPDEVRVFLCRLYEQHGWDKKATHLYDIYKTA